MFNVFKKLLGRSELTEEDISKVSDFVFLRWLSGNAGLIQVANVFNKYPRIPLELQLKIVQKIIAGRIKYIPYPKSSKEEQNDKVNYISEFFGISHSKALMYMEFISKEDLDYIETAIKSKEGRC